jgi:hypothetical protein
MRSIGSLALFTLLLCGSVKAQASPQLVADWTIAENMDSLTRGVEVRFWDVERDQSALESAIANREALRNGGFLVSAGQSSLQRLVRPAACNAGALVFGAYLQGSNP